MRVIAGKARRLQLKTVESMAVRPTTDRIKETLFNMINTDVCDCLFLDLFAGSGAIGIEALSRGAKSVTFVEKDSLALSCIRENLKTTHLEEDAVIMAADVLSAINTLDKKQQAYDIIFMDPPYNKLLEKDVLEQLENSSVINEDTLIIVEASLETDMDYVENMNYEIIKEKMYKTNKHIFVKKANA
ncbi:ribosomal RNA small subunit methyltransferase D [Lachnospiraceae bacterium KM106-2]|nr:ribosomal RNA small subunit methyltransferase D [Lachnospiraceae bacterium KM106-2]